MRGVLLMPPRVLASGPKPCGGNYKLTSVVSRHCLTHVSICSRLFSVLLSKLSATLVGKIEQNWFIRESVGHCIRRKAIDQLLNIPSSLRTLFLEDSLWDAPKRSSVTTAYMLFSDDVIAARLWLVKNQRCRAAGLIEDASFSLRICIY